MSLVVDSKHPAGFRSLRPTAVKPNWSEALTLLGSGELDGTTERAEGVAEHGERVLELTGADIAAVTLDREGAVVFERGRPPHRTYAKPADDSRAAGAGDTFLAALTLALAAGADTPTAAELAATAANYVVEEGGTRPCSAEDLEAELTGGRKVVRDEGRLGKLIASLREQGASVVFTNGCFDLLHRGHITYLNRAKTLGDVLVVGVNSDASVRGLKGDGRPINPLEDRLQVISALSCVDFVVPFDGPTPEALLRAIRPDRYVKGGDYTSDTLPERTILRQLEVQTEFLPLMQDRSTTRIIDQIRQREPA